MRSLYLLLILAMPLFAAPKVVVSIKPLNDITQALMQGIAEPTLLVPPGASPHSYALSPSQAKALYEADLIVWIGPGLEQFLTQPLKQRKPTATLITAMELPGMILYPTRGEEAQEHGPLDPHLWLDPRNLMQLTEALTAELSQQDPAHAKKYAINAQKIKTHLLKMDLAIASTLRPAEQAPLLVFHDAYQYFEKRYHLTIVGVITLRPDTLPSVARVLEIQSLLKEKKVRCVFSEPQFQPAIVSRLVARTTVRTGVLDPLGNAKPQGLEGIEALYHHLADNIIGCAEG
jgi:zinc transport system substrate-binding protein